MNKEYPPLFGTYNFMATATINFGANRFDLFAVGYKRAADLLVDEVIDNHRFHDTLVYPIVFLLRHFLELRLKEIIRQGKDLLDEDGDFQKSHDLLKHWVAARAIMLKIWNVAPAGDDFEFCEHVFSEFSRLDAQAMTFRYPEDKEGNNPLKGVNSIDLKHVKDSCEKVAEFLDGVSTGIEVYRDGKMSNWDPSA